jgi:hypothetical protein
VEALRFETETARLHWVRSETYFGKHWRQQGHPDRMAREMNKLRDINEHLRNAAKGHREELRIRDEAIAVLEMHLVEKRVAAP